MTPKLPDTETMYRAFLRKDASFEGIFVAGVKTTGIFCRPACTAKKPKPGNVEFFPSAREALLGGYRPCRVCNPMGPAGQSPAWLRPLLQEIDEDPATPLKDADLRGRGIDPDRARRWFRQHHGMTFQAYLRTLRLARAFTRIRQGGKVIDAAFESGYESLAGFAESFKKATGFPPGRSTQAHLITVTRILTPLGPMLAGATEEGICLLEFMNQDTLEPQISRLKRSLKADLVPGTSRYFALLDQQVQEYFAGTRKEFSLPLVLTGTAFQQEVWKALQAIPYGRTRSYQEQAALLGRPNSVRAVARANGDNRISLIIPCHRVIGKDGSLTGYGGGLWRKRYLLDLEAGLRVRVPEQ